jgi:membrane protease YdiL (CAAX protease family)
MLNKLKSNLSEFIFILLFLILFVISFIVPTNGSLSDIYIVGILYRVLSTLLPIMFILIFFSNSPETDSTYNDKNKIVLFLVNLLPILILIVLDITVQVNDNFTRISVIITSLIAIASYLSKYNKRKLSLKCSLKGLLFIIIALILYKLPFVLLFKTILTNHFTAIEFILSIITTLIFTALKEELIFRDFLLFGLISHGFSSKSANMVQAIIFGLIHISANKQALLIHSSGTHILITSILTCSYQILMGYLFGKITIKSKSIGYSVILHTFVDIMV